MTVHPVSLPLSYRTKLPQLAVNNPADIIRCLMQPRIIARRLHVIDRLAELGGMTVHILQHLFGALPGHLAAFCSLCANIFQKIRQHAQILVKIDGILPEPLCLR